MKHSILIFAAMLAVLACEKVPAPGTDDDGNTNVPTSVPEIILDNPDTLVVAYPYECAMPREFSFRVVSDGPVEVSAYSPSFDCSVALHGESAVLTYQAKDGWTGDADVKVTAANAKGEATARIAFTQAYLSFATDTIRVGCEETLVEFMCSTNLPDARLGNSSSWIRFRSGDGDLPVLQIEHNADINPREAKITFTDLVMYEEMVVVQAGDPHANKKERDALLAFFYALDGPNWPLSDWERKQGYALWNETDDMSKWIGITVVGGHVTRLYVGGDKLKGELPIEIMDLDYVTDLEIRSAHNMTCSTQKLGDILGGMDRLYYVDMGYSTGITGDLNDMGTESFKQKLPRIKYIGMPNIGLTGPVPDWLALMENEQQGFIYSYNCLTGKIPYPVWNSPSWHDYNAGQLITYRQYNVDMEPDVILEKETYEEYVARTGGAE